MSKLGRNLETLISCICEVVIGILLLINPIGFTKGIIICLGVLLSVIGIFNIVIYFRAEPEKAEKTNGLSKGLIMTLCGLFCILKPTWFITAFPIMTVFYGVIILVSGIGKLQWSVDMLRKKQKYWFIALIGALLSLLFATLIITNPFASTAILWTFIAVSLIVEAIADIFTFIFLRK